MRNLVPREGSTRRPPAAALALLGASLVLPSTALMQSHFRTRETLAYALAVAVLLFLGHRALAAGAFGWVGDAQTRVLAAVSFAGCQVAPRSMLRNSPLAVPANSAGLPVGLAATQARL